jgi:ACS family glucarate transporter-like MFS transporter
MIAVACGLFLRNSAAASTGPARPSRTRPDVRPLLRNRALLLLGLTGFGALWGSSGVLTWSNTLMVKGQGIDPVDAGVVLVLYAGIAIGIKPIVGSVVDRLGIGLRRPTVAVLGFFGGTLLLFGMLTGYTEFLWLAPLVGIGAAAYSPLITAMIPVLAGTRVAGSAAGAVNAFWQLGSVAEPPSSEWSTP